MYGLSLTASLLCASATLRLASATRRAKSSAAEGPGDEDVLPAVGLGSGTLTELGVGPEDVPKALFLMAATLAAISARFCAMTTSVDCWAFSTGSLTA
jgi:hypothetical protein